MNALRTIKNNWKKSVVIAGIAGYGVSTIKTNIDIQRYMKEFSNNVMQTAEASTGKPQNILVVMNPIANDKKADKLFKKYCEPVLHLAGYSVDILRTNYIGHAKAFVEELEKLPDVIVVAGGDGTSSEVVTGLLRRKGKLCPLTFVPLGRDKYAGKGELEYVVSLCKSLMPLLNNQSKSANVIQYDVLNEADADGNVTHLKPIYGLKSFSWGLIKDIDASKDKYWYFGPLRHYMAAFFRSIKGNGESWNMDTEYIYTPPCAGCNNCYNDREKLPMPAKGFFLTKKLMTSQSGSKGSAHNQIINDNCGINHEGSIKSNQINIALNENSDNYAELESRFINSLQPGWEFIKNIPNVTRKTVEPNMTLKSRTIKLYPAESNPNIFYSIDGEEYEPRPIKVSVVPNAIKVFC